MLLALSACASTEAERAEFEVPSRIGFEPVSELLHRRCGSLDCHGQLGRNLRLYGQYGLRASEHDVPGGSPTSADEHTRNYDSTVTLEPELLAIVTREGGAHPERLTLVRKARGSEEHKGGSALAPGSDADRCLLSWLSGSVDADACGAGVLERPP
jgi:hypothetical protein